MDIDFFKSLLLERNIKLVKMIERGKMATEVVDLDQTKAGRLSRADAVQGRTMASATLQRKQDELQRNVAALKRIEQNEYGYCLHCNQEIPEERLELDPTALLCIDCADKNQSENTS